MKPTCIQQLTTNMHPTLSDHSNNILGLSSQSIDSSILRYTYTLVRIISSTWGATYCVLPKQLPPWSLCSIYILLGSECCFKADLRQAHIGSKYPSSDVALVPFDIHTPVLEVGVCANLLIISAACTPTAFILCRRHLQASLLHYCPAQTPAAGMVLLGTFGNKYYLLNIRL